MLKIKTTFKNEFFEDLSPLEKTGYDPEAIKIPPQEVTVVLVCRTNASCVPGYEILNVSPVYDKPQLVGLVYDYRIACLFADTYLNML